MIWHGMLYSDPMSYGFSRCISWQAQHLQYYYIFGFSRVDRTCGNFFKTQQHIAISYLQASNSIIQLQPNQKLSITSTSLIITGQFIFENHHDPKKERHSIIFTKVIIMHLLQSSLLSISCILICAVAQTEAIAGSFLTPDCWRARTRNTCGGTSFLRKGCIWCNGLCKHHGACHLHKRCSDLSAGTPLQREICLAHGCKVQDRKCVARKFAHLSFPSSFCKNLQCWLAPTWEGCEWRWCQVLDWNESEVRPVLPNARSGK